MPSFATILLLGLAFVVLPFGTSWHEIPKVIIAIGSIAVLVITFFWQSKNHSRLQFPKTHKILIGGIYALSLWNLVTAWSTVTFFGNIYRLQGVLLLWGLLLWSIVSSARDVVRIRPLYPILALIALLLTTLIGRTDASGRAVGVLGEANSLGAYTLFLLPLTQSFYAIFPTITILFLSGSRSALLGLLAQAILLVGGKRVTLALRTAIVILVLIVSIALPFFDRKQDFDYRADIWRTALRAGWEKPITGWGFGNTEIGLRQSAQTEQTFLRYQYVDSSHNVFLDWWVQGGIIGLVLFTSLIINTIRNLFIRKDAILLSSFFGILAVMLFNPVSVAILVPFWWIIGVGSKCREKG